MMSQIKHHFREDIRTGAGRYPKLFVPTGDKTLFDPNFIRCPERVSFYPTGNSPEVYRK